MEQINKIELRGNVGNVNIREAAEGKRMARISLVTEYYFKNKEGVPQSEQSWHNIVAWEGKGTPDFDTIEKGKPLHVIGRLKQYKYTSSDGQERSGYEVVASRITKVEDVVKLTPLMAEV